MIERKQKIKSLPNFTDRHGGKETYVTEAEMFERGKERQRK